MKSKIAILAAALVVIFSFWIPATESFSAVGIRTLGLAIAFIILLVTEALPSSVSCWIVLGIMPLLGVAEDFGGALSGFSNPIMFFLLASFGMSYALLGTPLARRILIILLRRFGKNMRSFLFGFMLCMAIITAFISSPAVCAMFFPIGLKLLDLFDDEKEKKATGKALMIAIPLSCSLGGVATPAGGATNVLAMDLLEKHAGQTITFVQWMLVGIPVVILLLPVAWILIYKIFKPAEINAEKVNTFIAKLDVPAKITAVEKKAIAILSGIVILWILSSWVDFLTIPVVALLGVCIMLLPGVGVLEWKSFVKNINFNVYFLVATILSLGTLMVKNGVADWITTLLPTTTMPLPLAIAFTVAFVFLILIVLPVGPSVMVFMSAPLVLMAQSMGVSPWIIIIAAAMAINNCYILPLDTVPQITYGAGYYKMLDMTKVALPIQVYIVVLLTVVLCVADLVMKIA